MRNKKVVLSLALVAALSIGGAIATQQAYQSEPVGVVADETKTALTVVDVNFTNYAGFAGNCIAIGFNVESLGLDDWTQLTDTSKISLVDKDGNDVAITYVDTQGNYLMINRGQAHVCSVGDTITLKAGLVIGGFEIKEDVSYKYETVGSSFVKVEESSTPGEDIEQQTNEITVAEVNYDPSNWGAPTVLIRFNMLDDTKYGTYAPGDLANLIYVNAYGETTPLADSTYVGMGNFISRLASSLDDASSFYPAMVGDKITVKAGWSVVSNDNVKEYVANEVTYIFNADARFVVYDAATHDVTSLTITNEATENVARVGSALAINTQVNEGALTTVKFTSSDENIATVDAQGNVVGVSVGNATITATAGGQTATFEVEVKPELVSKGLELTTAYTIWVEKDATLAIPADFAAHLVYDESGKDIYSTDFALTAENTVLGEYKADETEVEGRTGVVPATITYGENEYDVVFNVNYYEPYAMEIKEAAIVEWFNFATFVQFPNSSANVGNITDSALVPDATKFVYERADGTVVSAGIYNLGGGNIAIIPGFIDGNINIDNFSSDTYYQIGDTITLQKGFAGYRWTGELMATATDGAAMKPGTGMIVRECVLAEEVVYKFDGSVWGIFVEYTDLTVANETIELVIDKTATAGAVRVPDNATEGEFTYASSNEAVATVSARGVITAKSTGTTVITITLTGGAAGDKTKTVTVTVVDAIVSLEINGELTVKKGTEALDLSSLTANLVYASGKKEAADLTNAQIVGYDKDTVGESEVTVKVTIGDKTYSGVLTVTVQEEKFGCGSSASALGLAGVLSAIAAVSVFAKGKKGKKED